MPPIKRSKHLSSLGCSDPHTNLGFYVFFIILLYTDIFNFKKWNDLEEWHKTMVLIFP